jgi:hypothetical protein
MSRARPAPSRPRRAAARRSRRAPPRAPLALAGLVLALALAPRASAQTPSAAAALFDEGLVAMKRGRFDEACPPLAESFRLDPLPGTAFTLAECEAHAGRVASAWLHYREYLRMHARLPAAQQARQGRRERLAREQEASLAARVPRLRLHVAAPAPPGAALRLDGTPLGEASWGVPLPLDPGEHKLSAEAAGAAPRTTTFTLAEGREHTVDVAWPEPPAAPPRPQAPAPAPAAPERSGGGRALFYAAAGVGVAGLVVGGVTGAIALRKQSVADDRCEGRSCADREGERAGEQAYAYATASTVSFAIGAGALAGAALLWLTEPRAPKRTQARWAPAFSWGPAPTLGVAGEW